MPTPLVSPMLVLMIVAAITVAAALFEGVAQHRRRVRLGELAREWGMQYCDRDVLGLSDRVASHLPVLGAGDVRITDLIYGSESHGRRYLFSAYYTIGVVRSKQRRRCVVSLLEPKTTGGEADWSTLRVAPDDLPLLDQYRVLKDSNLKDPAVSSPQPG